jgi:hypothetical protein
MRAPDRPSSLTATPGALSIRRQCALLGIACSGVYRPPSAANDNDLASTRSHDNRTALCKIRSYIGIERSDPFGCYRRIGPAIRHFSSSNCLVSSSRNAERFLDLANISEGVTTDDPEVKMTHLGERRHRPQAAQHETNDQCPGDRRC